MSLKGLARKIGDTTTILTHIWVHRCSTKHYDEAIGLAIKFDGERIGRVDRKFSMGAKRHAGRLSKDVGDSESMFLGGEDKFSSLDKTAIIVSLIFCIFQGVFRGLYI